jgi:DNA primase
MQDTAKYLVHADITADGVVERSDVVGAVFGQTEGLLGDELDLRELQDSSKVGRIDVDIDSENGQSFGRITIATSLGQVETAILGAALETIDRVGPCRSTIEVRKIEDVRAAKRREVVERAKTLLESAFDESMRSSRDLVEEVRESVRIEDITEYEGLPAGPHVADSDAIVVVEGRADVLTLLQYGIKNAVAVEGTDVPDAIAELTESRTVTAFLDGDRGGELIRKELAQVGDIDYVALAPEGRSVEDLERHEVMTALREKVPYEQLREGDVEPADADPPAESATDPAPESDATDTADGGDENGDGGAEAIAVEPTGSSDGESGGKGGDPTGDGHDADGEADAGEATEAATLRSHTAAVVGEETGRVRLLDRTFEALAEGDAGEAFELLADAESVPTAVVLDGELSQRVLDVAAQRGVEHVVAASTGEFVKRPTSVRVRTADQLLAPNEA